MILFFLARDLQVNLAVERYVPSAEDDVRDPLTECVHNRASMETHVHTHQVQATSTDTL